MKRIVVFLLVTCASQAAATKRFDIDRLYSLPWIIGTAPKGFTWSRDSQHLAFLWNDAGTNFYDAWITDVHSAKPLRVSFMPGASSDTDPGVSAVTWYPDNRSLLVTFRNQLFQVRPGEAPRNLFDGTSAEFAPKGEEPAYLLKGDLWIGSRRITTLATADISIESFYWSPDGKTLAFVLADESRAPKRGIPDYLTEETTLLQVHRAFPGEESTRRRLGFVSPAGGPIQWADIGPDSLDLIFSVDWAPDSKMLLVDKSDLYIKDRRCLLVDALTGKSSVLFRETDPKNVTAEWWARWAPDGRGVYFTSDRDNDYHVYYIARCGGTPKPITAGDWAVFSVAVSADALFIISNQGKPEERQLFRVPLDGGTPVRLSHQPGTHEPVISPNGRLVADRFSSDLTPPDLYLNDLDTNSERQITYSPLSEFKNYPWVAARYVTFANDLHGRLTLPPNFDATKKYPAILGSVYSNTVRNQWGGRNAHPTWGLDQYLAQQGYILLNVDIAGSSEHGKAFRQRIGLNYGGVDVEDLYSGVKFLESQGYVHMKRIGIWGSSYGGLLTTMSLFKKPGVFRAGVAGAPATSLFHALTGEMRTMMAPQDHPAEYEASSAFLRSSKLADHLMIIHGMRDQIVLFKDSVALVQRLIEEGKDVDLVALPNAPHGWDTGDLAQTRFAYHKLIDFFRLHLGDGSGPSVVDSRN
jgi:dipeptidyl-peptidase-4